MYNKSFNLTVLYAASFHSVLYKWPVNSNVM